MTSGEQDAEFFRERGFGLKIGFGARPALIVIDMIKAFTDPGMMLGSNLDSSNRSDPAVACRGTRAEDPGHLLNRDVP